MKKLLCLCLSLLLLLGVALPAGAQGEESKDEQLRRVTLQVKNTLDIGDDYTSFNGDSNDRGGMTWWWLSWNADNEGLNVTCDDRGKVYSMNRYFYDESYTYTNSLHFPGFGFAQAQAAAEAFLPTVLEEGEDAVFQSRKDSLTARSRYNLYGTLTLNGVETEIGVSLTFRTSDGLLLSFYRDDAEQLVTGGIPSPLPAFGAWEALEKFRPALSSSLEWSYSDYEKHEARLTYRMSLDYGVMLDARTGELLDRWNGYRGYANSASGAAMAEPEEAAMDTDKGLTAVELAGVEKLEGVLDGEALRSFALAESAFGLTEDFELLSVSYRAAEPSVDPAALEEGQTPDDSVTASFTLRKTLAGPGFGLTQEEYDELTEMGYSPAVYKYFTADANTGEIQSLSTGYNGFGWKEREAEEEPALSPAALDFLERRYGAYLPLCELSSATQSRWSSPQNYFTYTRMEAGYPVPMNTVSVTTNLETGFVDSFSCVWDEELRFGPSAPLVGEDAAAASFLGCYEAELRYTLIPQDPESWDTAYTWRLVYLADISDGWVSGVDAVTGEADYTSWSEEELSLPYTDLAGCYAKKEIETLADYGVRFFGVEEFQPRAEVTELDMLLLMLSCRGMKLDCGEYLGYAQAGDQEALRWIYSEGYAQSFIASREQAPLRKVSRTELCRCFVGLAGLSEAAELPGIYRTGFADEDAIPAADLGYVAIARGLGVVQGDLDGLFRPEETASRQDLALMLYRYLDR